MSGSVLLPIIDCFHNIIIREHFAWFFKIFAVTEFKNLIAPCLFQTYLAKKQKLVGNITLYVNTLRVNLGFLMTLTVRRIMTSFLVFFLRIFVLEYVRFCDVFCDVPGHISPENVKKHGSRNTGAYKTV